MDRPPGAFTLSVTRDGYVRNDQNVVMRAGQPASLAVTLEPSPDTGFEFTSEPPGGLVWLDGAPINGGGGQQARTDFRALRIPPGHHVLEIKGEARFKPWRQEIDIEPGGIREDPRDADPGGARQRRRRPAPAAGSRSASAPCGGARDPPAAPVEPSAGDRRLRRGARARRGTAAEPPARRGERGGVAGAGSAAARVGASDPAAAAAGRGRGGGRRRQQRRRRRMLDHRQLGPLVGGLDRRKNTTKHTPFVDYKLPCGKHKLAFKRPDMQIDHIESINIRPGQKFKQRYTLETEE